jgi:aminoglycoside phosphotransferase (APT) family kinase protein
MSSDRAPLLSEEELALLGVWLGRAGADPSGLRAESRLSGGTQNVLLVVATDAQRFVVRRPRRQPGPRQMDAIRWEGRILGSLATTSVPQAPFYGVGDVGEVFSDAPFVLTGFVDGFNPALELPDLHRADSAIRSSMGRSAVRALAEIGRLDHTSPEFSWLDNGKQFIPDAQVRRWSDLMASYREVPGYEPEGLDEFGRVADWLEKTTPSRVDHGLVHGDFHYGNLLFDPQGPDVVAVVDWELARVGSPLVDLGWFLISIPTEPKAIQRHPLIRAGGQPTHAELVGEYADLSGRRVEDIRWFMVFAGLKMGAILEGTAARAAAGQADQKTGSFLHTMTVQLLRRAADIIEGADDGF